MTEDEDEMTVLLERQPADLSIDWMERHDGHEANMMTSYTLLQFAPVRRIWKQIGKIAQQAHLASMRCYINVSWLVGHP